MIRFLQYFSSWGLSKNVSSSSCEESPQTLNVLQLKSEFQQFTGGSVDLLRNDDLGIAQICLNYPEKKNCISGKMIVDLDTVVAQLEEWGKGKGVIIYGAEHNFCSGGDLDFALKIATNSGGYKMATLMNHVLGRLQNLQLITVAFIEGSGALGGGAELAAACDFRLMSNNLSTGIGFIHGKLGIIPAWGGNYMLQKIVGYQTALDLITTTGRIIKAEEGKKIGLVNGTVDTFNEAIDWLKERIKYDRSVICAAKSVAVQVRERNEDILQKEKNIFSQLWGSDTHIKATHSKVKHRLN